MIPSFQNRIKQSVENNSISEGMTKFFVVLVTHGDSKRNVGEKMEYFIFHDIMKEQSSRFVFVAYENMEHGGNDEAFFQKREA